MRGMCRAPPVGGQPMVRPATKATRAETGPLGAGVDAKARLSRAGNNGDSALTPPCWVKRGESVINGQGIESIPGAYCECSHHDS